MLEFIIDFQRFVLKFFDLSCHEVDVVFFPGLAALHIIAVPLVFIFDLLSIPLVVSEKTEQLLEIFLFYFSLFFYLGVLFGMVFISCFLSRILCKKFLKFKK